MSNVVSNTTPNGKLINPDGTATFPMIKWMQGIGRAINAAVDPDGSFDGNIGPDATINGRSTLAKIVQFIDADGVVTGPGIDFARAYANKDTDHINDGSGNPLAGGKVAYAALVASMPVAGQTIEYDGSHWLPVAIAQSKAIVPSQFLQSYDAATGTFTSATAPSSPIPSLGKVNNQTGSTAYTTQPTDNGGLIVVSDASAVAVLLNSSGANPYFLFIVNLGSGTATLTPSAGTINTVGSISLLSGASCYAFYDGANWDAGTAIDASKVVLLNPTANQIITQPGSTVFEVKAGGTASELAISPTIVALIGPALTLNGTTSATINTPLFQTTSPVNVLTASVSGSTPGEFIIQALNTGSSASLLQTSAGITLFSGLTEETYIPVTSTQTINSLFGGSVALVDASAGDISITLPNTLAAIGTTIPADGLELCIIRDDATPAGHLLTILPTGTSTIQGLASLDMPNKSAVTLLATTNPSTGVITWQIQTDNRQLGLSVTITTAALTVGGTQGSQTFVGGILTAQVQAT